MHTWNQHHSNFRQQKKAIRILLQARVTFMHSIYYNYAPPSFNNTLTTYAQRNIANNTRNDSCF